ncbi:MAG: glycosyltransferase family 2 protein [candidate division Zixibacteria bacterium]|nr:glycosyltransferase family 2 protein [candidate division Zixibacteria bacterium]
MSGTDITVIIPVLNEEDSIGRVLRDIPVGCVARMIVVDNGSTDRTAEVATAEGALVVREPQRGYGAACLRGIEEAKRFSPDVIVFLDGDYSDHPEEMPSLVRPILEDGVDMVIGSRILGEREPGALPFQSMIGNLMVPRIIRLLYGAHYTDLGPFRAIRFDRLMALQMEDRNFGWTVEMQIKAARQGYRTVDVPVRYRRRVGVSKITGTFSGAVRAGFKILWVTFSSIFRARRIRRSV